MCEAQAEPVEVEAGNLNSCPRYLRQAQATVEFGTDG